MCVCNSSFHFCLQCDKTNFNHTFDELQMSFKYLPVFLWFLQEHFYYSELSLNFFELWTFYISNHWPVFSFLIGKLDLCMSSLDDLDKYSLHNFKLTSVIHIYIFSKLKPWGKGGIVLSAIWTNKSSNKELRVISTGYKNLLLIKKIICGNSFYSVTWGIFIGSMGIPITSWNLFNAYAFWPYLRLKSQSVSVLTFST